MVKVISILLVITAIICGCQRNENNASKKAAKSFDQDLLLVRNYIDSMEQILDKSIAVLNIDMSDTVMIRATYEKRASLYFCLVGSIIEGINNVYIARQINQKEMDKMTNELRLLFKAVENKTQKLEKLGFKFKYKRDKKSCN